jgi:hypothetical protein
MERHLANDELLHLAVGYPQGRRLNQPGAVDSAVTIRARALRTQQVA